MQKCFVLISITSYVLDSDNHAQAFCNVSVPQGAWKERGRRDSGWPRVAALQCVVGRGSRATLTAEQFAQF